ncbi:hypothetical protein HPB48_020214 [Haemaphysalis longicornis]|uniref:O-acyltransferase n=1 Tax=Haemaphysalis longicornis TaxID=44386 RepID=A0A9J6FD58_HAELO|nr:hypothetical protein HPB48_020214 [Haemaphysalis longicornis]
MEPSGCAEQLLSLKTSVERLRRSVNDELDSLSAVLDTLARKQNDLNGVAPSKHTTEAQLRKKRLQADMSTIVVNSTGILGVFGHLVAVNLGILFIVHPSLQLWAHCRALGKAAPVDAIFGSLFAVFLGCVTVFPARYIFVNELPPLSACILAFEQFLACVLMYSVVLNHFIKDLFCDAGKEDFQLLGFTLTGCSILLLGSISMFLVFYGFLHCWLNIFAEAMRFGDRLFYLDWWNSTTYADYYRSWNLVVHDWLFNYVYRDAYKLFNYNKKRAMLVVFFLSALVHEYILALSYRFFFPVILVVYGTFGVGLMFATKKKTAHFWNVFLWITLISGWGMILIFYTVEYYSRINCPSTKDGLADFFFPRSFSWSCNSFSHSIWFSSSFYKQKPPSLT